MDGEILCMSVVCHQVTLYDVGDVKLLADAAQVY